MKNTWQDCPVETVSPSIHMLVGTTFAVEGPCRWFISFAHPNLGVPGRLATSQNPRTQRVPKGDPKLWLPNGCGFPVSHRKCMGLDSPFQGTTLWKRSWLLRASMQRRTKISVQSQCNDARNHQERQIWTIMKVIPTISQNFANEIIVQSYLSRGYDHSFFTQLRSQVPMRMQHFQ